MFVWIVIIINMRQNRKILTINTLNIRCSL